MLSKKHKTSVKLFSYILIHDTGFSPNPFWGYCTLSCCKPSIRRLANIGDWIVGLSPKKYGNRLIYAMQVDEILDFHDYYFDERFSSKIPTYKNRWCRYKCGDNIYQPIENGEFRQLRSTHSYDDKENPETKTRDLSGKRVLIAKRFAYFGSESINLPEPLIELIVGRGFRNNFSSETLHAFIEFKNTLQSGVLAHPTVWPPYDQSWRESNA